MKRLFLWGRKKYRRAGLATKIVVLFAVIILIPAAIGSAVWIRRECRQVYEQSQQESMSFVEQAVKEIAANQTQVENTVLVALNQKDFLSFVSGDMDKDGLKLVKFSQNELRRMNYIFQSNSLIDSASFYFYNPELYEIWDTIYGYDRFENQEFAKRLHEERGSIFVPNGVTPAGDGYACCYHEVYRDTVCIGILEIRMKPAKFLAQITDVFPSESGNVYLMDREGNSLLPGEYDPALLLAISRELSAEAGKGSFKVFSDRKDYYGAYSYLESMDAYVVRCVAKDALVGQIYHNAIIAVLIVMLMMAVLYLIAYSVYRKMLTRLSVLMSSMRQVQEGDLSVRVEVNDDGDELDELGGHFNRMLYRMEGLIEENVERKTAAVNAELNALQSQINGHFLNNALESIRMMAEVKQETEIANTAVSLGSLLRYNMNWESKTVTLKEEIENIRQYIYFVNQIYGYDVHLLLRLEESMLGLEIPKMSLQPFVENSVAHGMPQNTKKLDITISAVKNGRVVVLHVMDNGIGMSHEMVGRLNAVLEGTSNENIRSGNSGIGIVNVHKRLQMNYGMEYGIVMQSEPYTYTVAKIVIPYKTEDLGGW